MLSQIKPQAPVVPASKANRGFSPIAGLSLKQSIILANVCRLTTHSHLVSEPPPWNLTDPVRGLAADHPLYILKVLTVPRGLTWPPASFEDGLVFQSLGSPRNLGMSPAIERTSI